MSDHDLALAYARRLGTIEGWLSTLLALIDDHGDNEVPRPIRRAAGFARTALDAPMLKVDGE